MTKPSFLGTSSAFAAALAMAATPATAAEFAAPDVVRTAVAPSGPAAWESDAVSVERYRGYRGHRGYRGRYRNRIDGGDILAGVLVLGGIAAIASAASRNNERRYDDRRYDNQRYDNQRYDDRRAPTRSSGIDSAVDQCVDAVERRSRVTEISDAARDASGWRVSGSIADGNGFDCRIDNSGRISNISYGRAQVRYDDGYSDNGSRSATYQNNQYDAQTYAEARRRQDQSYQPGYDQPDYREPSYPGDPAQDGYMDEGYGG